MILFDNASRTTASDEPVRLGFHQLYVANIDGSDVHQLTNDPVGASQGSWSPDGTKVVYLGGWAKLCCYRTSADVMVLDLQTGASSQLAHGPAKDFYHPFFSADGGSILFTRVEWTTAPWQEQDGLRITIYPMDDLWTMPLAGGAPELLLEDRGSAEVSPDGTSIVYPRLVGWLDGNCGSTFSEMWISAADGSDDRVVPAAADKLAAQGPADGHLTAPGSPTRRTWCHPTAASSGRPRGART